jgi:hypothetical protein
MIPVTQTKTHIPGEQRGNCMAACVASILELPIEAIPDVDAVERAGWHFTNVLSSYLAVHHGLTYATVPDYLMGGVRVPGYHVIGGPTVRTPATGIHHAVVGWDGKMVWDPHPARTGLTEVRDWSVLSPIPEAKRAEWWAGGERNPCLCPACGGVRPKPEAG